MKIEVYEKARKLIWEIERYERALEYIETPKGEFRFSIGDWCFNFEESEIQMIKDRIKRDLKKLKEDFGKL